MAPIDGARRAMVDAPALEVLADGGAVAERGAELIAGYLCERLQAAGRATLAVSGGRTPSKMFERLAAQRLPWARIALFQVDERVAPRGDPARNATQIAAAFAAELRTDANSFHFMPVDEPDAASGARRYAAALEAAAGTPPVLDVVHLGLGADGHTASLFPGAPLERDELVSLTDPHLGHARMTLTLGALNAARRIVWLVTGADKRATLAALLAGDRGIVASRVRRAGAIVIADRAAAEPPRRV
jgi:6-phosphogluconolactonase